ncbi:hypothetical protein [Oryza sativa Japonica Group]|uniref:Uncharacterized protein n=1 Tax=Oryza sativa subsp. japonica TaxID=39947 RepID=Q5ZDY4_ORYSJ|nr:hypothetical protein [Oryza sativa Japonica Group]
MASIGVAASPHDSTFLIPTTDELLLCKWLPTWSGGGILKQAMDADPDLDDSKHYTLLILFNLFAFDVNIMRGQVAT